MADGLRLKGPREAYKWWAFLAIGLSFVTIVMATSMVFVMLSDIAEDFEVTLGAVGWVVIVESLVISALLLPMGGLADRVGRRRVYVWGLVVFGIGSVLTGIAPTFGALIAARVVMAVGNALVQSVVTGLLVGAFPPEERGRAIGGQTTAVSVGAGLGPLLGGLALDVISWETLFFLLCIPIALSIVAALVIIRDDRHEVRSGAGVFDGVGAILSAVAVVLLVVTVSNPFGFAWFSVPIVAGFVIVAGVLGAFIRRELACDVPLLELRLFARPVFALAVSVRLIGFIGYTTTVLLLPIYLVSYRGLSTSLAGGTIFAVAVGMGVAAQISGNLSDRIGPRGPTIVGLVLQAAVALALASFGNATSLLVITVAGFLAGLALGLWNVPNNSAMMGAVPEENHGVIGAFTNVTRTMGNVLGQALTTAVVVAVMAGRGFDIPLSEIGESVDAASAFLAGWKAAYVGVIVVSLLALVPALRLPSSPVGVEPGSPRG